MSGRRFAYAGVIVGLGVSIWANVAHAMTAPHPEPGALGMAGFWPLALFLALEVLSRTRWAGGRALLVAPVGVALVAAVMIRQVKASLPIILGHDTHDDSPEDRLGN